MEKKLIHIGMRKGISALWPMFVLFFIQFLTISAGIYLVDFREMFGIPVSRPQNEIPYYFIQNDYVSGLLALIGLLLSLVLIVYLFRKKHVLATLIMALSLLYYGAKVSFLVSIYFRCTNLFTLENSTCAWSSFEAYQADIFHVSSRYIFLAIPIALFLGWGRAIMKTFFNNRNSTAT